MALNKVYKLNTGASIPAIGLGTWQAPGEEVYKAVKTAIAAGYRHIDTAFGYGNEAEVGKAIRDALAENNLERKDVFVTTKLWPTFFRPEKVAEGFQISFDRLDIEYIDLFLLHWPCALNPEQGVAIPRKPDGTRDIDTTVTPSITWAAAEKLLDTGKVKAVGVSNYSIPILEDLLKTAKVVPAVNQIELHPYNPQQKLLDYCASKGIHCTAYSPLGSTNSTLLSDETINKIATAHNKSPAQVILSWGWARSSILPKSVNPERVKANTDLVELSAQEIEQINELHKTHGKRFIKPDWGVRVFDEDFE
ncbi:NADP-dependent oxidoreductase domain-containing protein [Zychaea mexicana]|uniref:NADP-dependent oxidoreductase domain-containing protein n=1 Tax=Zychaea mexicana TaxID=64656 RepID=UPI0022FE6ADB|nr:NADP-dependent oxidoreductase domain-containing protein [Zychaea mexicana]KAI9496776.1 NADP-dependent oxidoreductase domain-containing protein [Zychaea mexicana]